MMHGHEKSSSAIVAVKPTNKVEHTVAEQSATEQTAAEPVGSQGRRPRGMADQHNTHRAQYRVRVPQVLACIRRNIAVDTRGGNRMRESCKYGSGAARLADILAGASPVNRGVQSLL